MSSASERRCTTHAAPAHPPQRRRGGCSRWLPAERPEEPKRSFSGPKEGVACGWCGYLCLGYPAWLLHHKKCKARRGSGVSVKGHVSVHEPCAARVDPPSLPLSPLEHEDDASNTLGLSASLPSPSCAEGPPSPRRPRSSPPPSAPPLPLPQSSPPSQQQQRPTTTHSDRALDGAAHETGLCYCCDYCGRITRSIEEGARHAKVCPAVPVRCPLHCHLTLRRGDVPQHLRDTALTHRRLCMPNASDYGGDDPRTVVAVLLSLLLSREPCEKEKGAPCAATEGPRAESPATTSEPRSPTPAAGGRSPSPLGTLLPPTTRLFSHSGQDEYRSPSYHHPNHHRHPSSQSPLRSPSRNASRPLRDVAESCTSAACTAQDVSCAAVSPS